MEFSLPFQYSIILLEVKAKPSTGIIWVNINSPPRLLCLLERVAVRLGNGEGEEALGVVLYLAGSREEPGTDGRLIFSPRRIASSSGVVGVPCLSPMDFRRETSTMSSLLRVIRRPCTFEVLMLTHRELLLGLHSSAQPFSVWAKARVLSCLIVWKSLGLEASVCTKKSMR